MGKKGYKSATVLTSSVNIVLCLLRAQYVHKYKLLVIHFDPAVYTSYNSILMVNTFHAADEYRRQVKMFKHFGKKC